MMRKVLLYIFLAVAIPCFSSGCTDSKDDMARSANDAQSEADGGDINGTVPISIDDYAQKYWGAVCAHAFACCSTSGIKSKMHRLRSFSDRMTEEVCVFIYSERAQNIFAYNKEAIEDGRLIYHADNAGKCVRELQDASCDEGIEVGGDTTPSCELVFDGLVENGAECGSDAECRAGRCNRLRRHYDDGTLVALGTCLAPAELGGKCAYNFDCLNGNICEYAEDRESNAELGRCQKPAELGEECRREQCTSAAFCEIDPDADTSIGICRALKPAGEVCTSYDQCEEETICLKQTDGEYICVADHCKL